jgi:hypothetical protein
MLSRLSSFAGPFSMFSKRNKNINLKLNLDSLNYYLYKKSFSFDGVNSIGVTWSSNSITSQNGGGWNDRGYSVERIPLGSPFKLKFKRGSNLGDTMCGLSQDPPINNDATYTRHSFGFYLGYGYGGETALSVTEGGNFSVNVVTNGSFPASTVYSIVYDGIRVKYYVNDSVFYTSNSVPTSDLFLYTLFLQDNKSIIDIEFGATNPIWDDTSPNGNDFNLINSPKYLNGSFNFNGLSQSAIGPSLGTLSKFTVDTWFKLNSLPATESNIPQIVTEIYDNGVDLNFSLGFQTDSKIYGGFFIYPTWYYTDGFTPEIDTWYNVTLTYDAENLNLYLNGNTYSSTNYGLQVSSSGLGINIGKRWDVDEFIDGEIDIVKIWDGPLSQTQILNNYNSISPRYLFDNASIVLNGNSSIEIPAGNEFALGTTYTIEFWSKASTSSIGHIYTVMSQRDGDSNIDIFYQDGNLVIRNTTVVTVEPTPGVWTHVAIVSNNTTLSVYYNGIDQSEDGTVSGSGGNLQNNKYPLAIGCRGPLNNFQFFNGSLWGIRINNTSVYSRDFNPYEYLPPTNIPGTVLLINERRVSTGDFIDSSYNKSLVNRGATHSTEDRPIRAASFRFGLNDITERYISIPASNDFAFGTNDFTVEWFQYQTQASPPDYSRLFQIGNYPNHSFAVSIENGNLLLWLNNATGYYGYVGLSNYLNQWSHFAISRQSGTVSIWQDGARIWTGSAITNVANNSDEFKIGSGSNQVWNGYISNFRLVTGNGNCVYNPSNYAINVPKVTLANVPGTKLLLLFEDENRLKDSSSYSRTITNFGATWSSIYPPYSTLKKWNRLFSVPEVTSDSYESVTGGSAVITGTIVRGGNAPILERGIVWSINNNPTISDNKVAGTGTAVETFTQNYIIANPYRAIYVRVYATNGVGTGYGEVLTFTLPCFVKGTKITMYDRTTKNIEDISYEDNLLVWNFDEGQFNSAKPLWIMTPTKTPSVNIIFSDGSKLGISGYLQHNGGHRIFNLDKGEFTYAIPNEHTPIGTRTFNDKGDIVTIVGKEEGEFTEIYNVVTNRHINIFAGGVLTSRRLNNIYPISDMKFIKDGRRVTPHEEFNLHGESIPEEYYNGLRLGEQPLVEVTEGFLTKSPGELAYTLPTTKELAEWTLGFISNKYELYEDIIS